LLIDDMSLSTGRSASTEAVDGDHCLMLSTTYNSKMTLSIFPATRFSRPVDCHRDIDS
jgi:hypothetical protein